MKIQVTEPSGETRTQPVDVCNSRVRRLFEDKPELTGVTLVFADGKKRYTKVASAPKASRSLEDRVAALEAELGY